ncbi:PxKF domain-containing protein [Nocardioides perillae]|uniref:Ig-like domain-containing protein n=1 Tax=Nocardioides perillae TaxID=1119534 RepID=A0A7Y9UL75_9ACTN|nr:PxKF domain-containing protein [Nocardioides perillae]NYG54762.1 hypothetical protein [Nocardioides perillae]
MGIRRTLTLAAALPLAVAGAVPAVADNVLDNAVSASVIDTGKVSTIVYRLSQTADDGEKGCNASPASPATVTLKAFAADGTTPTTGLTFSPTSFTFTDCGPASDASVTVTGNRAGSYVVKVGVVDSGPGSYTTAQADVALRVDDPNQAPTVTVTGVQQDREYVLGSVPQPGCSVTDDQAVTTQPTPTVVPSPFDALGAHTATCSYTDAGGKSGSASTSYTVVRPPNNAPTVAVTGVEQGGTYLAATPPVVGCDADDPDGPVADPSPTFSGVLNERGIGERTATCTVTDDRGATASDSRTYRLINTAPTVVVTGPSDASYVNGTQPADSAFGCAVADPDEPGLPSGAPTVSRDALSRGLGTVTVTCSVTDADGAGARAQHSYAITNSAPSVAVTGVGAAAYEIGSEPTVGCAVTDREDGDRTAAAEVARGALVHGLGTVTVTCDARDADGAVAEQARTTYQVVDTGAPSITGERTTPANEHGWDNGPVVVRFTCDDEGGSGIATCAPATATVTAQGEGQSVTGTATDHAGNTAQATVSGISIDTSAPVLDVVGGPAAGATYAFGQVPAAPTCRASDGLSGLDGACEVSGGGTAIGTHTWTVSARDRAGNVATRSLTYTVVPWTATGFTSPVDMGGVLNTVKGGSTVPLKFELFAGGVELTSTSAVASFRTAVVSCASVATDRADEVEVTTTGGTALRYDATGGQFVQNWQTPRTAGVCYRATMTAADGVTSRTAYFRTR